MAWMTWDTIINLADEVDYLWRGDVSWVKWIYTFIRYAPILHAGIVINHYGTKGNSSSTCKAYIAYELAFLEALTMAVEVILMIRVFVLYKLNQILRVVILVAFLAEVVSMIVTISFVIIGQHYTDDCIGDASPEIFVGYWCVLPLSLRWVRFTTHAAQDHRPGV
ncbi:hypothetical protein PHLGIDRAFT_376883 [Phlebiopsis gigantea 11061_1 CR5-6]|uniref:DUF6533 domain-containing protein n=1 Tax=Phlebiopsis gigantea (strain 11061_1 CR5-6) TaxID=745531 RepID=A0A0C3PNX6_PHLG1|nr:hypothetical protein PHLGIDRAFT_376883 [Phlebiopsis gigantea 11061_1 CR5-6]